MKHRAGGANVQAVWLFSRNDGVGNVAILVVAGLVWLTATPWPDLIVAAAIAGLFVQAAWKIIAHARRQLAEAARRLDREKFRRPQPDAHAACVETRDPPKTG